MDNAPLTKLRTAARLTSDGDFTISRVNRRWRVCFGIPDSSTLHLFFEGGSLDEAVEQAIEWAASRPVTV